MQIHAKTIETNDEGWIIVTADLTGLDLEHDMGGLDVDHPIYLRPEAIANRMVGYGLATPEEALDAILREHSLRLSTLQPKSDDHIDQLGGLDDRITVDCGKSASVERAAIFEQHAELIQQATALMQDAAATANQISEVQANAPRP